ncbi:MAG: hypothetical protein C4K49_11665 [Candidatus Thorarchaeota archaeon]|nr:MAG: hypothetical protein C4K49_11665 [Candidatus Thorarchaeota archaeon]
MAEDKDKAAAVPDESSQMAEEIAHSVEPETAIEDDGLTRRERVIVKSKEEERIRKARELKKQLRKRELGIVRYRWPALTLILSGVLSIWTEFLAVMVHPPDAGFDSFFEATFSQYGGGFFLFPAIAGAIMVVCGVLAYTKPKTTFLSVIPAMMMAMAGMYVFFLISIGQQLDPTGYSVTATPFTMLLIALISLISIMLREKE